MRIEFPHSSREDFHWTQVLLRIGSAADNDLVLGATQAAEHHLRIQQDGRGLVLHVLPQCGRVYVNARPVRERALLRLGDTLSVGDCRMLLRADEDPAQRPNAMAPEGGHRTVALRAVAGPWSGRVLPLPAQGRLELGAQGRYPLEVPGESVSLSIEVGENGLWLEALAVPVRQPLRVNGVAATRLALQPGDQIGLAMHRFVVDGPGLQPEPAIVQPEAPAEAPPAPPAGPRGEMGWLILTAAILALGIALVLLIRF